MIISGESGAGKTVSAKLILSYVTAVSPNNSAAVASSRGGYLLLLFLLFVFLLLFYCFICCFVPSYFW